MKHSIEITCAAVLALAACSGGGDAEQNAKAPAEGAGNAHQSVAAESATTTLKDASGAGKGTATVSQAGGDLRVRVEASGLPAGAHGAHLHLTGTCAPPDFASAGPHWNPTDKAHGSGNPAGAHLGDLPNLEIAAGGNGTLEYTISGATLGQLLDADGAAMVIHEKADDYRTDPSGNSGDRIACGRLQSQDGAGGQG